MAHWLKVDYTAVSGSNGSWLYKKLDTSGGIPDAYVQMDVAICQPLIDGLATTGITLEMMGLWDVYGDGGGGYPLSDFSTLLTYDDESIAIDSTSGGSWVSDNAGVIAGVTAGIHTVQLHIKTTTTQVFEYVIDGTTYTLSYSGNLSGWISQLDVFTIGGWLGSNITDPGNIYYITNVTAGTSGYGSTEILSDDFSSGDFSLWDGSVIQDGVTFSVIETTGSPCGSSPGSPATLIFDSQQAFRVGDAPAPPAPPGPPVETTIKTTFARRSRR